MFLPVDEQWKFPVADFFPSNYTASNNEEYTSKLHYAGASQNIPARKLANLPPS